MKNLHYILAALALLFFSGPSLAQSSNPFNPDYAWCNTTGAFATRLSTGWGCVPSQATGSFLASPAGSAGVPSFRTINPNDIATVAPQGFRNRLINGAMTIDQRNEGAVCTVGASSSAYCLDRWLVINPAGASVTVQRVGLASSGFQNDMRIIGGASVGAVNAVQRIESANIYDGANQSICFSAYVKASAPTTVTWQMFFANSQDNFSAVTGFNSGNWSATTTLTRFLNCVTGNASIINGLQVGISYPGASVTLDITGLQLERNSNGTFFEFRLADYEIAAAQRYYQKTFNSGVAPAQNAGTDGAIKTAGLVTAGQWDGTWTFDVMMRGVPTMTFFTPTAAGASWSDQAGTNTTTPAVDGNTATLSNKSVNICTNSCSSFTPVLGHIYYLHATASAEL